MNSNRLVGAVKASIAASMLWMLRQYMYRAYRLNDDRLSAFASGLSKKTEVKVPTNKVWGSRKGGGEERE